MPAHPDMLIRGKALDVLTRAAPKLIYGTIVLSAVIAPLRDPPPPSIVVIILSLFSLFAIGIAGAYAEIIRRDMEHQEITPLRDKVRLLFAPNWIMAGAAVPVFWFLLAIAGVLRPTTALAFTKLTLIFVLVFFGFIARRLCGGGWGVSILAGLVIGGLGAAVVQLKVWVKYLPELYL